MDMTIFQVESNKILPRQGGLLISAPFLKDFYFARSVVLMIEHNEEGSMGIVLNKNFSALTTLNELVPALEALPPIPLYRGGPVGKETLFFLHKLSYLKDALPLGNGLYVNGDFNQMQQYLLSGAPTQGVVRFFMGYALNSQRAESAGSRRYSGASENHPIHVQLPLSQSMLSIMINALSSPVKRKFFFARI